MDNGTKNNFHKLGINTCWNSQAFPGIDWRVRMFSKGWNVHAGNETCFYRDRIDKWV